VDDEAASSAVTWDSRTHEGRARQLAAIHAEAGRLERAGEETAHLPGGGKDAPARWAYWDMRSESARQVWQEAGDAMREARIAAGLYEGSDRYPTDGQRGAFIAAEAAWRACEHEYDRCRAFRAAAADEIQTIRDEIQRGW
jgi:hypothetical protein